MRYLAICFALGACGRMGFDAIDEDIAMGSDAATDASAACTEPWGAPVEIPTGLTFPTSPAISTDESTLYLSASGLMYRMIRGPGGMFEEPTIVVLPNNGNASELPSVTADGQLMVFTSGEQGGAFVRQVQTTDGGATWVNNIDTTARGGGAVTSDGLGLVVADFGEKILECSRASRTGAFLCLSASDMINTGTESFPALSPDRLDLYFARGSTLDLYVAHRATPQTFFTSVAPLGFQGQRANITADGRRMYYTAIEDAGARNALYVRARCE